MSVTIFSQCIAVLYLPNVVPEMTGCLKEFQNLFVTLVLQTGYGKFLFPFGFQGFLCRFRSVFILLECVFCRKLFFGF